MLSFSNGWLSVLLWPSRKVEYWQLIPVHSATVHQWNHPVREEKWLSSGLMPSSSTALMAGKSKLYITTLCVNTGTQAVWQMGQSCLLIVDSWLVSFACQNDHITNVCTYKCSHSIIVFLPLGHQKLNYSSLWVNKYAQGCVHCLATVASNINMHSQAWPPRCV